MRCLVVDDSAGIRAAVARSVRALGLAVNTSASGPDAMAALLADPGYAVVLLDVRMPGIDGIDLLRWIRGRAELAGIKVIMLTADASRDALLAASDAGCDAYLLKPVDVSELAFQLVRLLGPLRPRLPA